MKNLPPKDKLKELNIKELERLVQYHNDRYWTLNDPEISDVDYDQLVEILREKSPNSTVLLEIAPDEGDSPTLQEGKVRHTHPMLSLDKCYDTETLKKWFDKFEGGVIATPKIDGVAASIVYSADGKLLYAATRGDGRTGEYITQNAYQIIDLPDKINDLAEKLNVQLEELTPDQPLLEVRGETYMPLSIFRKEFKHEFKSPRNLTAGALKQKDPTKTLNYKIHFFAYDIILPDFVDAPESEVQKFELLQSLGFSSVQMVEVDFENLDGAFQQIQQQRKNYDFELDGVVYKANLVADQVALGLTSHHPRYAIAYKFQGDFDESILREVHWSVSRTGTINPVAIIDPVSLSGAVVTRCSLHNLAIMEALDADGKLRLNSRVLVTRRGGVIPHLESVIEPGDVVVEIPSHCPGCQAPTCRENDFLCADHAPDCSTTQIRRIEHFASVMSIKGFGPKLIQRLFDEEILTQPADFYTMTRADLLGLERVGEKLADRLLASVAASKATPVATFLRALGIDELGRHVSAILAPMISNIDDVFNFTTQELAEIHTIGDIIAQKVVEGLKVRQKEIIELAELIGLSYTTTTDSDDSNPADTPLEKKSFLFTGTLESMKRKEAQQKVQELGGTTPSSVSKELNYLVIGDKDFEKFQSGWQSSKLKKVVSNNEGRPEDEQTKIISETMFLKLIES